MLRQIQDFVLLDLHCLLQYLQWNLYAFEYGYE